LITITIQLCFRICC